MPLTAETYVKTAAIVSHATLVRSLELAFPHVIERERAELLIDIIDLMARRCGFSTRPERSMEDADGE